MNHFEKIEAFLDGILSAEEEEQMNYEMQINTSLAYEIEKHKQLRIVLKGHLLDLQEKNISKDFVTVRKKVELVYSNYKYSPPLKHTVSRKLLLSATAMILFILVIIIYFFPFHKQHCYLAQVATQYEDERFSPELLTYSFETMSSSSFIPFTQAKEAKLAYADRDFEKALSLINSIPENYQQDFLILKGLCLYQLEQYDKAIASFQLLSYEDGGDYQRATWYLFLAQLKLEDDLQAGKYLQKIMDSREHYQYETALAISRDISCLSPDK